MVLLTKAEQRLYYFLKEVNSELVNLTIMPVTDIADKTGMARQTIYKILNSLTEKGLINYDKPYKKVYILR